MTSQEFPYEIIEEFIRGGCSIIYKVKPRESDMSNPDDCQFVLKTMSVSDDDPQSYQRFYMEWEFLRAYPHPNLVKVKEYFKDWHGRPAYVMEWVDGHTWADYFRDINPLDDLQNFLHVCKQLCDALDYIHNYQIIHRDLKPQNVLVNRQKVLKLIDFGIMKVADLTLYADRNTFMGSAYYVAPEGISGEQVNHTADIFALGVMLYDLFTGVKPFQGHTLGETIYQRLAKKPKPPSQLADLPEELDGIILKMLDREPRNRQQSSTQIFEDLEKVFGKFVPEITSDEMPDIDVLTKGPFFHSNLLKDCRTHLRTNHLLYIKGDQGSGKTTIVENLCSRQFGDVLRLDCHAESRELSFMEVILKSLKISSSQQRELKQWMEILGSVIPALRWPTVNGKQTISPSTVLSAFKRLLQASTSKTVLLIEDLHNASPTLLRFVVQLACQVKEAEHINLILTTQAYLSDVANLTACFEVGLPDTINLIDYLTAQFSNCQVPLDLAETLVTIAGPNLSRFMRTVQRAEKRGSLLIRNGVLEMADDFVKANTERSEHRPELQLFSSAQIACLEWVALCPEVDVNTLLKVADMELTALSATIDLASNLGLFEFQSSAADGFLWRNEQVQDALSSSLSKAEKTRRYSTLARTIEAESQMFLSYSPPLWLVLCRLFQQAGELEKAAHYGLKYAHYCSQTANYQPVRDILSPFISLPIFQGNQEFWSMLAMANKDVDIKESLIFAKKALKISEKPEILALLGILEHEAGSYAQARSHLESALSKHQLEGLDPQYTAQLLPILISLGQTDNAKSLFSQLDAKLKGRNDLFATNTLLLAKVRLLQAQPQKVITTIKEIQQEVLSQTKRVFQAWCCRAYQQRFDFNGALNELEQLEKEVERRHFFEEALFLFLNFDKSVHLKNLISLFHETEREDAHLKPLDPLFQLASHILVHDPKAHPFEKVVSVLQTLKQDSSSWLALIATRLELTLSEEFLTAVIDLLVTSAGSFARGQMPRLRSLLALKRGEYTQSISHLEEAAVLAHKNGLIMEQLRILALHELLAKKQGSIGPLQLPDIQPILNQPAVSQFIKGQYKANFTNLVENMPDKAHRL